MVLTKAENRGHEPTKGAAAIGHAKISSAKTAPAKKPRGGAAQKELSVARSKRAVGGRGPTTGGGKYQRTLMPFRGAENTAKQCQYPLWSAFSSLTDPEFGTYCGKKVHKRSYCEEHFKLCWTKHVGQKRLSINKLNY